MKRLLTLALAATVVTSAFAQTSFTIRRPVDGSKVRETVAIRIPKSSLVGNDYIGIYIDDKFIEAAMPTVVGDDYVYNLDTKARKLADGPHKVELVLFRDPGSGGQPRIVDRTSVTLVVDNYSSIKVPENGFDLRYKYVKGQELKYSIRNTQSVSMVSQALANVGGTAAERTTDVELMRVMYATDNVYNVNGRQEALLRIQPLPYKGRDYAILTVTGETEPRRYYSHEMHPFYLRVDDKGREKSASIPFYVPLEGTSGDSYRFDLFLFAPPPVLPLQARKPGDVFRGTYQLSQVDLEQMHEYKRLTSPLDVAGTFMGVEWYRGIPVAKMMLKQAMGREDLKNVQNVNAVEGEAVKIEIEQYIYFDIAKGRVVRMDTNMIQSTLVDVTQGGGSGGSVSNNGGGGRGPEGGGGGRGPVGSSLPPPSFFLNRNYNVEPQFNAKGDLVSLYRLQGGPAVTGQDSNERGPGAGQLRPGGERGGFTGNNQGGGGGVAVRQILTIRTSNVFELEF